ncbi:MAG: serine/threonine protein kinase, partial [Chloroflexota bacterium]|nr:serine/threonine protein kinase [Chloroflexota bacterium]
MISENSYINKQIGNYRVISEVASGAFGRVYLAQHVLLTKRIVAIKLLHSTHLGSPGERESFLQEAQFLEQLKHPYILPIIDVSIEEGFPYLVAEYAANGSLRNKIKSCAPHLLPLREILTILTQIGQALHYAHQQHIIHRDLKPENILFNAKNEVLLADFGLATSVSTASMKHVDNAGTPRYMAPEQFQGNISKESDQYALACIAYELFTGHQPFTDPDFFTLAFKHLTENPTPPTQLNPYLPVATEQVILKAMAKQRADRYRDIADFITALVKSATASPYLLRSSLMEMPTIEKDTFPELKSNVPTNINNSSRRITEPGMHESNNDSTFLKDGQYDTAPKRVNVGPITPIPPSYHPNPVTPSPALDMASLSIPDKERDYSSSPAGAPIRAFQSEGKSHNRSIEPTFLAFPADKQGMIGTFPRGTFENKTQIPFPDSWPVNDIPRNQKRKYTFGNRWLIIVIVCMVLFTSGIGAFLFVFPPTLFSDSSSVIRGGTLHLHGRNFFPASNVTLTLDNGLSASYVDTNATSKVQHQAAREAGLATAAQMMVAGQFMQTTASTGAIALSGTGTFAVAIKVSATLPLGKHTIHASEGIMSRSAELNFTVVQPTLVIQTSNLDFGKPEKGIKPILPIEIDNTGAQPLSWTADTRGTPWLKLSSSAGTIGSRGFQLIDVAADTNQLALKAYTATKAIN